jgi:hypothetical protein
LTERSTIRATQRLIAACVLIAFSGALGGCSSGGFDPSDLLDFLDTKKKLPGDRKPVFPDGVPGLEQGVPRDLYKGAQQQPDQPNAQAAAAAAPPPEPPPSKQAAKKKGKAAASVAAAPAAAPADADAVPEEDTTPAAPPAPKPKKIARKRTTAPPPDDGQSAQQGQGAAFPAPVPSGTFTR